MQTEIQSLEQSVAEGKALITLMKNKSFKKLFIDRQESKLLEIGYSMSHLDADRKTKAIAEMEHISYFFDSMYDVINSGNISQGQLNDIAEEEAYDGDI